MLSQLLQDLYLYRRVRQQPTTRKAKRKNKRLLERTILILIAFPGFYLIFRRGLGVIDGVSHQNRSYILMKGPFMRYLPKKNFENVIANGRYGRFPEGLFYEKIVLRVGGLSSGAIATRQRERQNEKTNGCQSALYLY